MRAIQEWSNCVTYERLSREERGRKPERILLFFTVDLRNYTLSLAARGSEERRTTARGLPTKLTSTPTISKNSLPVWKSDALRDIFSTRCEDVNILELLPQGRDAEFGHLNLRVTESPVGDPSVPQPYEPTVHDVLTPAVRISVVNVLLESVNKKKKEGKKKWK